MNFRLDWAVWMLFLSYRGLGLLEIGLVETASQPASLLFCVPAGVFSDRTGRKISAFMSVTARAASFVLIIAARDRYDSLSALP